MPKANSKKRKRVSVTDTMKTVQEKLQSAVDRKLVKMDDRGDFWVVVPGQKGHANYIYNIKDRLKADGFIFTAELGWYKRKHPAFTSAIGDRLTLGRADVAVRSIKAGP